MTRHGKGNAASSLGEGSSRTGASDSITPATTQQSGELQTEGNVTFAGQAVEQIQAFVESFRTGKIRKSQAIFKIGQVLAAESGDEQLKSDALEQYSSTLDGIEALSVKSHEHGERLVNPLLGKRKNIPGDGGERQLPEPLTQLTSTTSLTGYPRELTPSWETTIQEEDRVVAMNHQTMSPEVEVVQTKSRGYMNPRCHGSVKKNALGNQLRTPAVTRPEIFSTSSKGTSLPLKDGLGAPRVLQQGSPARNGMLSSKEKQSTLIPSSVLSTTSIALTKASDVLGLLRSSLEDQNQRRKLKRAASGPLRSISSLKLQRSSSPTDTMNTDNMETTWKSFSPQSQSLSTLNCSNTMKQSGTRLDKDKTSSLPIEESSSGITKQSSLQMVSELKGRVEEVVELQEKAERLKKSLMCAIDSMEPMDAVQPPKGANINISAKNVNNTDMERWTAKSMRECEQLGRRPRYLRYNVFRNDEMMSRSCAEWTEVARPLASVPDVEFNNTIACDTIKRHPGLFTVSTPIDVDVFEDLLENHPNPMFVNSVVKGLRDGFWPWADTHVGEYPDTLDESLADPKDQEQLDFICAQRDKEIEAGRFSCSFGEDLLPGMYSMPIHVVPKPHSTDFRLVTNHSAGIYSLNSMIKREDICGFPLDNMTHLGEMLLKKKKDFPDEELVLYKSDISDAYRNLPMHPLWQIKQVNTIQRRRHVDRRNCFGGKGSGSLFIAFNSLVTWIGKNVCRIPALGTYSDDSFGVELASNVTLYEPYSRVMPSSQVTLLKLWDRLGIPHKEKKQVFGTNLTIIGIDVDANNLTLTLPKENKLELIALLSDFARPPEKSGVRYSLRDFQHLAGWFNWALNVYPMLKPALSNIYSKMGHSKPDKPLTKLYVNNSIRADLQWAVFHLN